MASLNISLPEPLRAFVEEQVASGKYGTASEYVERLVREAQTRRDQERLETLLLEGIDSGSPIEATPEFWEKKRSDIAARHTRTKPE